MNSYRNKQYFPLLATISALIIVSLACSIFTPTSTPIVSTAASEKKATQPSANTLEPATPTTIPLPTMTASPAPSGGQLTGSMVWLTSGTPVEGAGIMLCRMSGDICLADADLTTTTQVGGAFEFQNLDAGKYVILYNPNGSSPQAAGLSLDLSDQSLQCAAGGLIGSAPASCQGSVPIFGDGDLSWQKGSSINISASGFTLEDGSLVSEQYGVYLDFANGMPISAQILDGQTTEMVFKAWDK